jgi:predicted enzyme related to lactoylglutathione lyase
MHKSQLGGFIIDCKTDDLEQAAAFWSAALGLEAFADPRTDETMYRRLITGPDDLEIEVQKVDHESRVHLDIETDDIEAEARRLESKGAKRISRVHSWLVMEAPTGQRFCLVKPYHAKFQQTANTWD